MTMRHSFLDCQVMVGLSIQCWCPVGHSRFSQGSSQYLSPMTDEQLSSWSNYHCLVQIVLQTGQRKSPFMKCCKVNSLVNTNEWLWAETLGSATTSLQSHLATKRCKVSLLQSTQYPVPIQLFHSFCWSNLERIQGVQYKSEFTHWVTGGALQMKSPSRMLCIVH